MLFTQAGGLTGSNGASAAEVVAAKSTGSDHARAHRDVIGGLL
jgi:hypothetical protein